MASNEEIVNEWLLTEYGRMKEQLLDLAQRHETIVNTLADVCRRNDRMQAAGDKMRDLLDLAHPIVANAHEDVIELPKLIDEAIQKWGEANV